MTSNTTGTLFAPFTGAGIAADSIQHINATGNVTAWTSLVVIGVTPPTANMVLTLPSALGNIGETIKFVRVDSTAFTVTLAAQAGETITFLSAGAELNTQHGSLAVEAATTTEIRQVAQVSGSVAVTPLAYFATGLINSAWGGSGLGIAGIPVVASPATATPTAPVPFNDPSFAVSANVGGFTTSATGITVPVTGTYSIAYRADVNTAATGAGAQLLVNGALVNFGKFNENPSDVDTDGQLTLQWLGPITAGQTVQVAHVRQDSAGTDVVKTANMVIEQVPTSTVVDPGMVPVESLDYVSYATTHAAPGAIVGVQNVGGRFWAQLDSAGWVSKYDPANLVTLNAAGDSVVIANAGLYEVQWNAGTDTFGDQALTILVNGAVVASGFGRTSAQTIPNCSAVWIGQLNVGDAVAFAMGAGANMTPASFSVKQLPTSTVVDPGLITPTPLHRANWYGVITSAGTVNGGANTYQLSTASGSYDPNTLRSGETIVIEQSGVYRIFGTSDAATSYSAVAIFINGVNSSATAGEAHTGGDAWRNSVELIRGLTAGDIVSFSATGGGTSHRASFSIEQLPTSTVVDPGAVTVNDQAASGYMDVGTCRFQWGQLTNTSDAAQFVTLPAAFASTAYSLSLTPDDGWTVGAGEVTPWKWSGKTTTSFNVDRDDDVSGTALVDWIAIGRKP